MRRATYYDNAIKQYVLVGNVNDALIALGKLEDHLEKLEPKTFGEFMASFRHRRNISQASFAAALHISRDTVKLIESGKHTPSYATLTAMSDTYKISLDILRFAFRRYAFHLKDEALNYMIVRQDNVLIEPTMYHHIGTLLQCERQFLSENRKQLSAETGLSVALITKYESGEVDIPWTALWQFGKCLNSDRLLEVSQKLKERIERKSAVI